MRFRAAASGRSKFLDTFRQKSLRASGAPVDKKRFKGAGRVKAGANWCTLRGGQTPAWPRQLWPRCAGARCDFRNLRQNRDSPLMPMRRVIKRPPTRAFSEPECFALMDPGKRTTACHPLWPPAASRAYRAFLCRGGGSAGYIFGPVAVCGALARRLRGSGSRLAKKPRRRGDRKGAGHVRASGRLCGSVWAGRICPSSFCPWSNQSHGPWAYRLIAAADGVF